MHQDSPKADKVSDEAMMRFVSSIMSLSATSRSLPTSLAAAQRRVGEIGESSPPPAAREIDNEGTAVEVELKPLRRNSWRKGKLGLRGSAEDGPPTRRSSAGEPPASPVGPDHSRAFSHGERPRPLRAVPRETGPSLSVQGPRRLAVSRPLPRRPDRSRCQEATDPTLVTSSPNTSALSVSSGHTAQSIAGRRWRRHDSWEEPPLAGWRRSNES